MYSTSDVHIYLLCVHKHPFRIGIPTKISEEKHTTCPTSQLLYMAAEHNIVSAAIDDFPLYRKHSECYCGMQIVDIGYYIYVCMCKRKIETPLVESSECLLMMPIIFFLFLLFYFFPFSIFIFILFCCWCFMVHFRTISYLTVPTIQIKSVHICLYIAQVVTLQMLPAMMLMMMMMVTSLLVFFFF